MALAKVLVIFLDRYVSFTHRADHTCSHQQHTGLRKVLPVKQKSSK